MSLQKKIFSKSQSNNEPSFLAQKWKLMSDRGLKLTDKQHRIIANEFRGSLPCDSCGGKVQWSNLNCHELKINNELTLRLQSEHWSFACESCKELYLTLDEHNRFAQQLLKIYNSEYKYMTR